MARDFDREVREIQTCIAVLNGYTAYIMLIPNSLARQLFNRMRQFVRQIGMGFDWPDFVSLDH